MEKTTIFGFAPSVLDGTEAKFEEKESLSIPDFYSYQEYLPRVLNQGNMPICVPCSISAHLEWNLNVDNSIDTSTAHKMDILDIYNHRTTPGNNGMSFKDALSYLRHHGISSDMGTLNIKKYAMIQSVEQLRQALVINGPCIGGLPVYNSTGINDFWDNSKGAFEGGHAISIVGYTNEGFIIRNSWGMLYGKNGYGLLKYGDFDKFMEIWTIVD